MPTAQRAPAAFLVRRGGERLLFDCAEGTQRQLQRSSVGLPDLEEIFLTHLHADHFLGLPGMLKTFALRGRDELGLTVYGPGGVKELFARLRPFLGRLPYPLTVVEVAPGETLERGDYRIAMFAVDHGVAAVGYAIVEDERPGRFDVAAADALGVPPGRERGTLQRGEPVTLADGSVVAPDAVLGPARPGRKIVLTGDTAPAPSVVQAAHLRRPARPRGDLRRRGEGAGPGDAALDGGGGGRGRAARGGSPARAHARLDPLLRLRARRRGARGLPGDGRPARLRRDRGSVPRARRAAARQGWRAARARRGRMIQWR